MMGHDARQLLLDLHDYLSANYNAVVTDSQSLEYRAGYLNAVEVFHRFRDERNAKASE